MEIVFQRQAYFLNPGILKKFYEFIERAYLLKTEQETFIVNGNLRKRYFFVAEFLELRAFFGVESHLLDFVEI